MNETTKNGKNIVEGFKVLGKFCSDAALLLITANGMMKENGWTHISKNTKAVEQGNRLEYPDSWLPDSFFCFYENLQCKHLLSYIAVHVGDYYGEPATDIKEPRISAGWLNYGKGKNAKDAWKKDYRACYVHLWIDNSQAKCDASLHVGDLRKIYEDEEKDTPSGIRVATFAHKLEEITNSETLREKIVQPLLNELRKLKR